MEEGQGVMRGHSDQENDLNLHVEHENCETTWKEKKRRKKSNKTKLSNLFIKRQSGIQKRDKPPPEIVIERCRGCFKSHFPHLKLCRLWKKKHGVKEMKINPIFNEELIIKMKQRIDEIENNYEETMKQSENEIIKEKGYLISEYTNDTIDTFFCRSEDASDPFEFPDLCSSDDLPEFSNQKLLGGGQLEKHVVPIKSDDGKMNAVLSFYRNMDSLWRKLECHNLCDHRTNPACFYCLLRSLSLRSMKPKVNTPISPVEVLGYLQNENYEERTLNEMLNQIMHYLTCSELSVSSLFQSIYFHCKLCDKTLNVQTSEIINLKICDDRLPLQEILNNRLQGLVETHLMKAHSSGAILDSSELNFGTDQNYLLVALDKSIDFDLTSSLQVGGKFFKCISGIKNSNGNEIPESIETIFRCKDGWATFDDKFRKRMISNKVSIQFLVFEVEDYENDMKYETSHLIYERTVLNDYFRRKTSLRKESGRKRQKSFAEKNPEKVKEAKKTSAEKNPEKVKESGRKRQKLFAEKNPEKVKEAQKTFAEKNPEKVKESGRKRQKSFRFNSKMNCIEQDTGMEMVCAVCLERKSSSQCSLASKLSEENYHKYIIEHKLALSIDGNYHICMSCKLQLKQQKEPRRCQKEIFGFLNFPESFKLLLETLCTPRDMQTKNDPQQKYLSLNKCEDYLLKLCIPFIRVAHLPRGRYFKLIGDLILISADIMHSIEKIIPLEQSLIPVSFKRRLQYKGYYIEEYVDKQKLLAYFDWFRENNHLFKDFHLDTCLVETFVDESMEKSKIIDEENHENELDYNTEEEFMTSNHATHLRNKYTEDINSDSVANNLADLIIHFEKKKQVEENRVCNDEEEIFYSDDEDEVNHSDEEELVYKEGGIGETENYDDKMYENDDRKNEVRGKVNDEDTIYCSDEEKNDDQDKKNQEFQVIKHKVSKIMDGTKCMHSIDKMIKLLFSLINDVQRIESRNDDDIKQLKKDNIDDIKTKIKHCTYLKSSKNTERCSHDVNYIGNSFEHFLDISNSNQNEKVDYATNSAKEIKEKAKKIYVAPGEKGKFINWQENIFTEEMAFPALFPFGCGGYLSSNILSGSDIGFANYCRNRIMSVDPKFRNDQNYIFFLLLVKELIEIKRSKSTYLRKAAKHPNLTKKTIKDIKKEDLNRNNNVFNVYKNLRGSSPYYQKAKNDLFATIRQHGAPTLFQTFSCAEFEWDMLCKQIYEVVYNEKIDIEVIKTKDNAWKNKLVSENVVQSTLHFQKRTQKLIALMCSDGFYDIKGKDGKQRKFNADHYFYRVEFQQRGAPHIHSLLWLKGKEENGEEAKDPPALWIEDTEDITSKEIVGEKIAEFASSIISGSSSDAHCLLHNFLNDTCPECLEVKRRVEKFQKHKHTFTCKKKKKMITILSNEGHGKNDTHAVGDELKLPICRFRLPFYPMNQAKFIFPFEEDCPQDLLKKAEKDFAKVRKFILRMTSDAHLEECPNWSKFKEFTFESFLHESGMFDDLKDDANQLENAMKRYLNALRCDIRGSGMLILRRDPRDVFTNNYNIKLMNYHSANQDIQYVSDMWACAQYVTNYLTKSETNISSILKKINEEGIKTGLQTTKILDKLSRALDKNREVSIQETVYRILGLPMCKFSKVVQFISTVHPHKRDGLLRANTDENDENIFHDSLFTYYEARPKSDEVKPKEFWDELSVSEFVANFDIFYGKPTTEEIKSKKLIRLEKNKGFIKERKTQKTLRYYLNHKNDEDFCRALCILFLPFRNELTEIHMKNVIALVEEKQATINEKRSKFEKHITMIELIERMENIVENNVLEEDDEDDQNKERYIEDETTDAADREEFEKLAKKDAKLLLDNFRADIDMYLDIKEFRDLISGLNNEQRRVFDDFVERLCDVEEDKQPFYLYIGGEAGTGKSHLLRIMIEATKYIGKYSGSELEKPSVLVMAPTGNAAYIINGKTIESALGMRPQKGQGYMKLSSSVESTLRFTYENVLVAFVDEVSMVGSNKLARINFRLQDIMGHKEFMAGVPFVVTGDFGQLPPVGDTLVWKSSSLDGRPGISPNYWDDYFKIVFLTEKMRTNDDRFAKICDKVRKGMIDEEVQKYLQSRVVEKEIPSETFNDNFKHGKLSIIVPTNIKREQINNEKLEKLLPDEVLYYATATDTATNFKMSSKSNKQQSKKDEGQLSASLLLKKHAPVVITSNHSEAKYRQDGVNNGARGYVDSIQTNPDDPNMVDVVWVVFNDKKIGQKLRQDKQCLLKQHKPESELAVPIEKLKKEFRPGSGNIAYQRSQFPLTLAYALTSHKCQGQTLDEVIIDFRETRIFPASFYVAMTRVKMGDKVYLRKYDKDFILFNEDVEKKMESMKLFKSYSPLKVYLDHEVYCKKEEEVKIGYLNINGVADANHGNYLNQDKNLLNLDILVLAETKLKYQSDEELKDLLSNWNILLRQDANDDEVHMGMLCLISKGSEYENRKPSVKLNKIWSKKVAGKMMNHMQMINLKIHQMLLSVSFIYIRKTPVLEDLDRMKKYSFEAEVLMGDFNINGNNKEQKTLMSKICADGKRSVLNDVTTDQLNQLDYILIDEKIIKDSFSTAFKNFISNHKCITIRIPKIGNQFCDKFLARQYFDEEHHLKQKRKFQYSMKEEDENSMKAPEPLPSTLTDLELTSLHSPNWIKDEVIEKYFQLIQGSSTENFTFTIDFFTAFKRGGYAKVKSWYRNANIFECKKIFIPVLDRNHYFLVVFDNENTSIESYDPYDFPNYEGLAKEKMIEENRLYHEKIMKELTERYFKPKFEKHYTGFVLDAKRILHTPPEIPPQINDFDCGVYLMQFAKHIAHGKPFEFSSQHMLAFREEISLELIKGKFTSFRCFEENVRRGKEDILTDAFMKQRKEVNEKQQQKEKLNKTSKQTSKTVRRFENRFAEDCWMNATLQLMLTGLDHAQECKTHGSQLWEVLMCLKNQDFEISLDPSPIKQILLSRENERVLNTGGHSSQLFEHNPSDQDLRIGQQDARDFFICIRTNQDHYNDVFTKFSVSVESYTECQSCQHKSSQSSQQEHLFLEFECPVNGTHINDFIANKLNQPELVSDWRDEDGCNLRTLGNNYNKVSNVNESEFFIIVIQRLVNYGRGSQILRNKLPLGGDVQITDMQNQTAMYRPLAVIFHIGDVHGSDVSGHYKADVQNIDGNWFRTSDNEIPRRISQRNVSDQGYIFLFKRLDL